MDAESEEMEAATASVHVVKNLEAKSAEPIGWPSRRHPSVSSTGIVRVLSVGLGLLENCAIVCEIEAPRGAFRAVMSVMGEVPLHDVSILVFDVLTKHPNEAPLDFSVSQRNWRSSK